MSGTDPTGYACDAPLGSNIKSCEVAKVEQQNSAGEVISSRSAVVPTGTVAAWIANQKNYVAQNGAGTLGATSREQKDKGANGLGGAARRAWNGISNALLPSAGPLQEVGQPGSLSDDISGAYKGFGNTVLRTSLPVVLPPGLTDVAGWFGVDLVPQMPIENNELAGSLGGEVGANLLLLGMGARGRGSASAASDAGSMGAGKPAEIIRVMEPGKPIFQLRQGEQGLSVFDANAVKPIDVLPNFRPGSQTVTRTVDQVQSCGLMVLCTPGNSALPPRLRDAHREIRPGEGMTRNEFKKALKNLEEME